ncbi:putative deleted in malignant brain tumors 1 protein-like [Apostichopus japonicus]|uniref:Putative deleted in malignant brain tumors 1 protein-like n=1 Tax=Stichopus japonicus TaxID=307972 RepID=A0A2G8K284_STIJA|nr:putative deleted in malignant brain tumors 1 protein-like [Apostichopus japonicus]
MDFQLIIKKGNEVKLILLSCLLASTLSQDNGDVRLSGGSTINEGRVEIYYRGSWGTVCDDGWRLVNAEVVCRQLGLGGAEHAYIETNSPFGPGTGKLWLDDVRCIGTESRLDNCSHRGWGLNNCRRFHAEDAGVRCSIANSLTNVRLVNGYSTSEGRLEIFYDGQWGTVCDDSFDTEEGNVICRQLNYTGVSQIQSNAYYGEGVGPIMASINCYGLYSELQWTDCSIRDWNTVTCSHDKDVGLTCLEATANPVTNVRLVNGYSTLEGREGRLEIFYNGQWGTVCDDSFNTDEGNIICRQLGYTGVDQVYSNAYFGEGVGPIMASINCYGYFYEQQWTDCSIDDWDTNICTHSQDVGLTCHDATVSGDVRLINGYTPGEGTVQIYYNNEWGTICDDNFDLQDGHVICRQLGYSGALQYQSSAYYGEGNGPILYDIDCSGWEDSWRDCYFSDWGTSSCSHSEDIGLQCTHDIVAAPIPGYGDVQLINSYTPEEGTVQIYYNNEWGTICDDSFDLTDGHVICRQLGYSGALQYQSNAYYGEGDGPILYELDCNGWEDSWRYCNYNDWDTSSCSHSEDIGLQCTHVSIGSSSTSVTGLVVTAIIVILIGVCCCSICAAVIKKSRQPRSSATAAGTHQQVPHQTNQMAAIQPLPTSGQTTQTAVGDNPPAYMEVMSSPMKYPPPGTQSNPAYPPQNYPQGPTATQPAFAPYPTQQAPVPYPAQSAPYPQQSNLVSYPQYPQVSSVTPSAPPMVS